jgi:nucleotide-binding universal stress UspA family protein
VAPNGAAIVPVVAAGTGAFAMIEASRDADLVVVGTRGRSGLVQLIAGSTTLEVLAHAHCAVAVVR